MNCIPQHVKELRTILGTSLNLFWPDISMTIVLDGDSEEDRCVSVTAVMCRRYDSGVLVGTIKYHIFYDWLCTHP